MSGDMSEFLNVRVSEVVVPEDLPTGMFKFVITRYSIEREANDTKTPYILGIFKPVGVVESESEVNLDNVRTIKHKFYHTPKAQPYELSFLTTKVGLSTEGDPSFGQLWEQALGREVIGMVKSETKDGKNGPWTNVTIERFFKAD